MVAEGDSVYLTTPSVVKRLSISSGSSRTTNDEPHFYDGMLEKNQKLPQNPSVFQSFKYSFSLPPHHEIGTALTWFLAVPMFWAILYSITGKEALPGGNLFSVLCLLLLANVGGYIVSFLHLPPLLGMLLVGIAVRSLPGLNIIGDSIDGKCSATLRKTALVIILTKAGLGLDPKALRELALTVLRVGIFPNVVETSVVAVIAHFLLDFPWLWSFMMGFVLSGVSPSVVVPCILGLSDQGYGVDKGIPTLVIAGLSVDNVISISGFGVMLGIIFSGGSIVWQAFKGPLEIGMGIVFGMIMGSILWYIPNSKEKGFSKFRFVLLFTCGLFSVFGSKKIGFAGCGPLGCLATSFVAAIGWRRQGWMGPQCPIKKNFNFLWKFFLPLLFGLIGSEIEISALNANTVGFGILTIVVSVVFRFIVTFFSVMGSKFNVKERMFIAIAWIPKATIQAAIGSAALEAARLAKGDSLEESEEEKLGKELLTIAVLAILAAAPLGAAAIMIAGPKLLNKQDEYTEVPMQEKPESLTQKV